MLLQASRRATNKLDETAKSESCEIPSAGVFPVLTLGGIPVIYSVTTDLRNPVCRSTNRIEGGGRKDVLERVTMVGQSWKYSLILYDTVQLGYTISF